mgnify:CR=1 FL=1
MAKAAAKGKARATVTGSEHGIVRRLIAGAPIGAAIAICIGTLVTVYGNPLSGTCTNPECMESCWGRPKDKRRT